MMNIKKWAKNKWVRTIGWATIVLLCLSFWGTVIEGGFRFIFFSALGVCLFTGLLCLLGFCYKQLGPQMKRIAGDIGVGAIIAGIAGLFFTMAQERIFKFPHRFSDQLWLSNSIIGAVLYMMGRWQKRKEVEHDRDS